VESSIYNYVRHECDCENSRRATTHGRWCSDASRLQRRNRLDLRVCNWGDPLRIGSTAILHFEGVLYYAMGYPNDEVLNAHPLYANGLGFYGFHVVENSPLIADLDRRNQVHERHVAGAYMKRFRHWIITFHDETLEVVARNARFMRSSEKEAGLAVREHA
jgi:hypothetical protein